MKPIGTILLIFLLSFFFSSCEKIETYTIVATPYTTVTDTDGNTYKTIKIGDQIWMAENLKTTKYNDGQPIPNVLNNNAWGNLTTPAYSWFDNKPSHEFGIWYNWYAVNTDKLAPIGWHIPTDAEWKILAKYLGGWKVAGGKMKSTTSHWDSPNIGATNESGFSALPANYRNWDGVIFSERGFKPGGGTVFWSVDEFINSSKAYGIMLHSNEESIEFDRVRKSYGRFVRCIKNK